MDSRWLVAPLLSTLIAMSIQADEWEDEYENSVEQISYEGDETDSIFISDATEEQQQLSSQTPNDPYPSQSSSGQMFASAMPTLEGGWGIILTGEWLYWRPNQEGFEYGVQSLNYSTQNPFPIGDGFKGVDGSVSKATSEYSSGYRIGFDLKLPKDAWDLSGTWTRFSNTHHNSISQEPGKVVWALYLNDFNVPKSLSAKSKLEIDYSVLDLELGRSFFVAKHLSVRPFVGFTAAWIQQEFTVDYIDVYFLSGNEFSTGVHNHNHNKFSGYGMNAGFDTKWPLAFGFSLEGDLYLSLLFAKTDVGQFEKHFDGNPRSTLKDSLHSILPVVDMFGGISWETQFAKKKYYLNVHAGWEEQVWFKCNHTHKNLNGSGFGNTNIGTSLDREGNLTLSGWTVGAKFGF